MKILINVIFASLLLTSCKKDESLASTTDDKNISVVVQKTMGIEIMPLGVMYRSNNCPKVQTKANGEHYEVPGYNFTEIAFNHENDINPISIPLHKGKDCAWTLSNITFSFRITTPQLLNDKINRNIPINEVVTFDNNSPQRLSGPCRDIKGDLVLDGNYFPVITQRHINSNDTISSITRAGGDVIYRTHEAKIITFKPRFHPDKKIEIEEPLEQKNGEYIKVRYPDGTTTSGSNFPDYEKISSLIKN